MYYVWRIGLTILFVLSLFRHPVYAIKHWDITVLGYKCLLWRINAAFGRNTEGLVDLDEVFGALDRY